MPASAVGMRIMPHVSAIAGGPHELFFFHMIFVQGGFSCFLPKESGLDHSLGPPDTCLLIPILRG